MNSSDAQIDAFEGVQRLVLTGQRWLAARTLMLHLPRDTGRRFLHAVVNGLHAPTAARRDQDLDAAAPRTLVPDRQLSIGFTRRGLEALSLPWFVMAAFAAKSPAFMAGAALRASTHLRLGAQDLPGRWDSSFDTCWLHAVITVHAMCEDALAETTQKIVDAARVHAVPVKELPESRRLETSGHQLVHFGYRDGLSRIGIRDWTRPTLRTSSAVRNHSWFGAGEFLLGHAQTDGPNPWLTGPDRKVWPAPLRAFFRNGSFGVLQQIEQDVKTFETVVGDEAHRLDVKPDWLKARLCGRQLEGRPLADPQRLPDDDFDYRDDAEGYRCPFGSHVRRMNPRELHPGQIEPNTRAVDAKGGERIVHGRRARPLIRRGMPYGPLWPTDGPAVERGLMGHFFCASLEEQYEHLLGLWADRVPMGSADGGRARDPLIGAHEPGDGVFEIPMEDGMPLQVKGLQPFTRTRGIAYLFYPSVQTVAAIADSALFVEPEERP